MLAVDIGNSRVKVADYAPDGSRSFKSSFTLPRRASVDDCAAALKHLYLLYGKSPFIDGAAISSVVPTLTPSFYGALEKHFGVTPLVIGPGVKTGLNIRVENAASVGADIVIGAVGALSEFRPPLLIINMGTATTFTGIDSDAMMIGVAIMPGLLMGLDALAEKASELSPIALGKVKSPFGRNTVDSMNSGAILGAAGAVDGYIDIAAEALVKSGTSDAAVTAVITGGCAKFVAPYLKNKAEFRESLCLDGLWRIWKNNQN
ncbi:MAG: type III pantothenate kinase [Eubacteriales bacterium]|jgi:type III pantothenate kinase